MEIRSLRPADAAAFQALRLEALRTEPKAFGSSAEEEAERTLQDVAERLGAPDVVVLGAYRGATLVGSVGLLRHAHRKERHKALLWGMYVTPGARGTGTGRRLVAAALEHARAMPALRQVHLAVGTYNRAAIALYEGQGFAAYGTERHALVVDGEAVDELHMVCVVRP